MPCDIGFKSYAKIEIPVPAPQTFTVKSEAPDIDADLLEKLGVEDPEFLEWVSELSPTPLLEEALKRTLLKVRADGVDFTVNAKGMLEARGSFTNTREKERLRKATFAVSDQWQFEILGIVAELLNFNAVITQKGKGLVLEAEEAGKAHPCDYIKITRQSGIADIVFEHFKSRKALDVATAKFLALAHKLGVKISLGERTVTEGDPFPGEERLAESVRHGHCHER